MTVTVSPTACPTTPPPLTCDNYGYLIQYVSLYQVDLSTGDVSLVANNVSSDDTINTIGYNSLDNFIYGRGEPSNRLRRISSAGTSEAVTNLTSTESSFVGDIDSSGFYVSVWLAQPSSVISRRKCLLL